MVLFTHILPKIKILQIVFVPYNNLKKINWYDIPHPRTQPHGIDSQMKQQRNIESNL